MKFLIKRSVTQKTIEADAVRFEGDWVIFENVVRKDFAEERTLVAAFSSRNCFDVEPKTEEW